MPIDTFGEDVLATGNEKVREARNDMIKEVSIGSNTRPFFEVYLKGRKPTKKVLKYFYDENLTFQNNVYPNSLYEGAYFCTYGRDLTGIDFQGGAVGARHGTVNINDPLGVWPEIIGHVSEFSNGAGRGQPNMLIRYGWTNYSSGNVDKIEEYWSIMTETNFELDENGLMKLSIKFVEGAVSTLRAIKFLSLKDMYMTDPSTNEDLENQTKTVDELLHYMIDNTSIGTQLARNKIILQFEECSNQVDDRLKMKDYSVRFGDNFYDMINKLTAKAVPPSSYDTESKDYAYKIITDKKEKIVGTSKTFGAGKAWEFDAEVGDVITILRYGWIGTDKDVEGEERDDSRGSSMEETHNAVYLGNIVLKNGFQGEGDDSGYGDSWMTWVPYDKTALSFSLDMKPFGVLHGMINSQLQDTLKSFDNKDWNLLKDDVEEFLEGGANNNMEDFEASKNEGWWFFGEKEDEFADRKKLYDEIKNFSIEAQTGEGGAAADNAVASQLRAWIKMFPLQSTIEILGDPVLGSRIAVGDGYFKIFFNTPSYFTDYLNGMEWLMTEVSHKIDNNGMYKTELKLTANVSRKEEGDEEDDSAGTLSPRMARNITE